MSAPADRHDRAPYAAALHLNAGQGWTRLGVPGHQDQPANYPSLTALAGPRLLAMDIPMFTEGVDLAPAGEPGPSPLQEALDLAADAWGAKRTWFLTNGASQGNHAACLALRALSGHAVVQRSVTPPSLTAPSWRACGWSSSTQMLMSTWGSPTA